ncbi:hypothetical protein BKA83DRAFT_2477667 [Pisolithus microcarpus]|nr:hypothetical protein BKA83DRAFT_2477667 [Pisolithus microcarpus]
MSPLLLFFPGLPYRPSRDFSVSNSSNIVSTSPKAYLLFKMVLVTSFLVWFFVQCFYSHRVWIIGDGNVLLTGVVLTAALAQLVSGFALLEAARLTGNIATLFSSQYAPINAFASTICDIIITTSVYFYFRRSQARLLWKPNYIRKLKLVVVQMGLITFLSALTTAILYYQGQPSGQYLAAAPCFMLSKAYSNSMLAVLNARKLIYDQQQASSSELPTLSSVH